MKKTLILFFALVIFGDTFGQLFPVLGGQRAGISTAQFLKIGVGGRASAMGDAFVAVADDASSLFWNPAGLVQFEDNQVVFSHNSWVVDIKHNFVGAVYHLSDIDAVGVSFTSLTMDDMKVTTEFAPFGTGEYFSFSDLAVSVSYARKMTDKFSFGGTVRYIEETLAQLKMRGILIDLGTYYWTGLGTSRFAVSFTNFGNQLAPDGDVVLIGNRKKSQWQEFSPPTMFRLGFAFEPYQNDIHKVTASVQLNHPNDNSESLVMGGEYTFKERTTKASFILRGGYKFNVDEQNFSLGAGVKMPFSYANVTVDYAYVNFVRLGQAHRLSILLGL
ncbi:MAG: PorV/PorQ family protein [Ignavibacteriaceae bacterium]|nr:PorV/PorQ family protein [Ignavibacteriaceae bacterium]NUM72134.1 PorV/PorQ family protein [Ignavibacteriaceae bacterium]